MMKKLMERMRMIRENQKKNGTKGFSMIELIIVIAIMAILIALIGTQLLPYLEKSRKSKDLSTLDTCLTNFKAALAEAEIPASQMEGNSADGIDKLDATGAFNSKVESIYKELAGEAYDEDSEQDDAFKSDAATAGQTNTKTHVQFVVSDDPASHYGVEKGLVYVMKGDLIVCESYSGELDPDTGKIPVSTTP